MHTNACKNSWVCVPLIFPNNIKVTYNNLEYILQSKTCVTIFIYIKKKDIFIIPFHNKDRQVFFIDIEHKLKQVIIYSISTS